MQVRLITAPASPALDTADARAHCHVTNTAEDTWFADAVEAATRLLQTHTGKRFITCTLDLIRDDWPGGPTFEPWQRTGGREPLELPGPVQRVADTVDDDPPLGLGVYYTQRFVADELTLDPTTYVVDVGDGAVEGRIVLKYGQVWPPNLEVANGVRVRYLAGYGDTAADVPDDIRQAIKVQVAEWYENRGDDPTVGVSRMGDSILGKSAKAAVSQQVRHRF